MQNINFTSEPMRVTLTKASTTPMRNVVAAARTCYSENIVTDDKVTEGALGRIAPSIYEAGHHTTYQHPFFQFAISGVSRHFVYSFLHSHPHYNSEQQSQRYVHVAPGSVVVPNLPVHEAMVYDLAVKEAFDSYERISRLLRPAMTVLFRQRFRESEHMRAKHEDSISKRCQEIARYVLPIGTKTTLYHTVSGLVAMRYVRGCESGDLPSEQRIFADAVSDAMLAHDPEYAMVLQGPAGGDIFPENTVDQDPRQCGIMKAKFDMVLRDRSPNSCSVMSSHTNSPDETLADCVREILGVSMPTEEAVKLVMDPSVNKALGEKMNMSTMNKVAYAATQVVFSFKKKLSHTADSQDQRHRMVPGGRPLLSRTSCDDVSDFVFPYIMSFEGRDQVRDVDRDAWRELTSVIDVFETCMSRMWSAYRKVRAVNPEAALYLLPNATAIRFTETGDLSSLAHKFRMRLCYNAQEEVWRASQQEAAQIAEVAPLIGKYLLPPCTLRSMAGMKRVCPEGPRYCGVRVWEIPTVEEYARVI